MRVIKKKKKEPTCQEGAQKIEAPRGILSGAKSVP